MTSDRVPTYRISKDKDKSLLESIGEAAIIFIILIASCLFTASFSAILLGIFYKVFIWFIR